MKYAIATIVLLFASLATAQEIPVVKQCRAQGFASSLLDNMDESSIEVLTSRLHSVSTCLEMDAKESFQATYKVVQATLSGVIRLRIMQTKFVPNIQQCRADQRQWMSEIKDDSCNQLPVFLLAYRSAGMNDCASIDPAGDRFYGDTSFFYATAAGTRYMNFVYRHDLVEKFTTEDLAGKR